MADRTIKQFASVPATSTATFDSVAIPSGKILRVVRIGGAAKNTGDNISSTLAVQFGIVGSFTELAVFECCGNTFEFEVKEELVGDGVKFLRLSRQNGSSVAKRIILWVKGYDY